MSSSAAMLSDRQKTIGTSLLLHASVFAFLATFAVVRLNMSVSEETEVRIIEIEDDVEEEEPEPEPEPEPELPEVPTEARPVVVPAKVVVAVVEEPKPFQEDAIPGDREAPEDAEAIPTPSAPLTFAMTTEVGGGADYESTTVAGSDTGVSAPGVARGREGTLANQDAIGIKVAKDWEVTTLPDPINDRSFEPDYPPLARNEKREASVRLELDVATDGSVASVRVLAGPRDHGFRASAIAYAKKLRFVPARSGKREVAARIEWTVYFYARD